MTLRQDCKCACHSAPHAMVHFRPCCGPGSERWANVAIPERDPYKALSLFGNENETMLPDTAASRESVGEES